MHAAAHVAPLAAQTGGAERIAEGRIVRPDTQSRPRPVAGQWVVLHRVGSDRAAPLDSVRSGRDGRFRFRYTLSGAADALYFVSARYAGIAYFSPPLRESAVRGGDADVVVYDTTSDTATLHLQGRHFILSMPRGSRREVAEVFELENEGARTVVARDSLTAIWSIHLPALAESASVAPGDVSAGAVVFRAAREGGRGIRADIFAPISPGVRQLVLTYLLPAEAFPLTQPSEHAVSILEVLLEDPRAAARGAGLSELEPATIEGRPFRRFIARDVPPSAVIVVDAPRASNPQQRKSALIAVIVTAALALLAGIATWRQRRGAAPRPVTAASEVDRLVASLAVLDARFESSGASADERAAYEKERAGIKERIATMLAAPKTQL